MNPLIFLNDDSVIVTKKIIFVYDIKERFSKHGKYSIEIVFIGCSKKEIIFDEYEEAEKQIKNILDSIENYIKIQNMFINLSSILCIFNTRKTDKYWFFGILLPMKMYIDFKFDTEKESEYNRKELINFMRIYYGDIYGK
jgi:hypothetical protein